MVRRDLRTELMAQQTEEALGQCRTKTLRTPFHNPRRSGRGAHGMPVQY
ncbi:hypothetical protein [Kitasatospora griseola]